MELDVGFWAFLVATDLGEREGFYGPFARMSPHETRNEVTFA